MVIKVLFFDTSALLKIFVEEEGTPNMKWLTSSDTKVSKSLHFVVNEQVCSEFERKLEHFANTGKISSASAERISRAFTNHYKDKYFRVIGQEIISNTKMGISLDAISQDLNLKAGKNDWDGLIYQSIVNALAFLGGESYPILVTCDGSFGKKVMSKGYQVINPAKQRLDEIRAIIASQETPIK